MKPDQNYKMSKTTKIFLESIHDREKRSINKKLFCEAEYHSYNARRKMSIKVVDTEDYS